MFELSEKNAYKQIREGLDATWDREFYEWLPQGKGKTPGWVRRRFVITQEYNPSQGYGTLEMHPEFMQHLIDLSEKYTDYALRNIQHLRSFNAMRLYELLTQYAKIGSRTFSLDWFQEVLTLSDSYERWTDLKKHVLVPSLESIHQHTDIEIIKHKSQGWIRAHKTGRAVTSFTINFRRKQQQTLDLDEPATDWQSLGYASAGEHREAQQLMDIHDVEFRNARDFMQFKIDSAKKK